MENEIPWKNRLYLYNYPMTIYKIKIEYENEKDKFDIEPHLNKRLDTLVAEMFARNPKNKITITKDIYEESN